MLAQKHQLNRSPTRALCHLTFVVCRLPLEKQQAPILLNRRLLCYLIPVSNS